MKEPITRLDYCQYLLVSQINYTLTNFADHSGKFSHDRLNRYLGAERLTPRLVWDNVEGQIIRTPKGYVIFDDTVLNRTAPLPVRVVTANTVVTRTAWSKGIGVVTMRLCQSRVRPILAD